MTTVNDSSSYTQWAKKHFGGAICTDIRRQRRLISLASQMMKSPGKSIPQLGKSAYEAKSSYNLLSNKESCPDYIQKGHRELVQSSMNQPGTYLLIEDDSTLSWSGKKPIPGLGPVGDFSDGLQGFILHSVLVAKWPDSTFSKGPRPSLEILGLADQQSYLRERAPIDKRANKRCISSVRKRESDYWFHSVKRIGKKINPNSKWIRVCDRAADIYELFSETKAAGYDYLVRALQDRALVTSEGKKQRLFDYAREAKSLGCFSMKLRSRPGKIARSVKINISARSVKLRSPARKSVGVGKLPPIECYIIHAKEDSSSQISKNDRIEWFILSSQSVNSFEEACTVVQQYSSRWIIEDFHKALKSGCGAERLQLKTGHGLIAAVALMSVVASRVIQLKEGSRANPEGKPETSGLSKFELEILGKYTNRSLNTIYDVALAVGRLGGHLNRKGDGPPGIITLTRGLEKLLTVCEGARLLKFTNQSFG